MNIDNKLSVVVNTLDGSFFIAYLIGYFVKKDLLGEVDRIGILCSYKK